MYFLRFLNLLGLLNLSLVLSSCSYLNFDNNNQQAPVSSISSIGASYYTVQEGDTVEGISDGFNVTVGDLALWNHLTPPYNLNAGERLRVKPEENSQASYFSHSSRSSHSAPASSAPVFSSMEPGLVIPQEKPNQSPVIQKPVTQKPVIQKPVTPPATPALPNISNSGWMWPIQGHVSSDPAGGIDIDSKIHQANVVAAKAGKVIYAGPDVSGDGKLVILDNSDGFLSAYGNLESIHVQEGVVLDRADSIGKVRSVLHFDIRQSGNSLDALKYLP